MCIQYRTGKIVLYLNCSSSIHGRVSDIHIALDKHATRFIQTKLCKGVIPLLKASTVNTVLSTAGQPYTKVYDIIINSSGFLLFLSLSPTGGGRTPATPYAVSATSPCCHYRLICVVIQWLSMTPHDVCISSLYPFLAVYVLLKVRVSN